MALTNLTKVQTVGIGSNIEVVGVVTTGQFKSGTSNLHSTGVELTNLNVSGIATIGGNVSIGGTLTYQDVTNIDSVGIITARAGVNITGGNITLGDSGSTSDDRIVLGAGSDFTLYHDGSDSVIKNSTGVLKLITEGGTTRMQGTGGHVMANFIDDGAVELYYNNTKMLETNIPSGHNGEVILGQKVHVRHTASGNGQIFPASGNMYLNAKNGETSVMLVADAGVHLFYDNAQKFVTTNTGAVVTGILTATSFSGNGANLTGIDTDLVSDTSPQLGGNLDTNSHEILLDTSHAINFGDGTEMNMKYHGGHGQIIYTGNNSLQLKVKANSYFQVVNNDTGDNMIQVQAGGLLSLWHNGSQKFETRSDGTKNTGVFYSTGNVLPWGDNNADLGSASNRWRNLYTTDLQLSNKGSQNDVDGTWGNYTIQEGESDLFLINNRNGKKYKFNLTEVS